MSVFEFWSEGWWQEGPKWHHWCLGLCAAIPPLERSTQVFGMGTGFSRKKIWSWNVSFPWKRHTYRSEPMSAGLGTTLRAHSCVHKETEGAEVQHEGGWNPVWLCCCVSLVIALHHFPAMYGWPPCAVFLSSLVFCQLCNMQAFKHVRNLKVWSKHWEGIKINKGVNEFCCVIA